MLEKQPLHGCYLSILLQELRFELVQDNELVREYKRGSGISVMINYRYPEGKEYLVVDSLTIYRNYTLITLPWVNGLENVSDFQIRKQLEFWLNEPVITPKISKKIFVDSWGRFMDRPACDLCSTLIEWNGYHSIRQLNESGVGCSIFTDEDNGISWIEIEEDGESQ